MNVCVSVPMCMSAYESETKSHLGQGSYRSQVRDQITFGPGTKSVCVCKCDMCKRAFESKTKLHLGQGSNRG